MTPDGTDKRFPAVAADERVGKVFIVVGDDLRMCLICEQMFTRQGSFEHSKFPCHPASS